MRANPALSLSLSLSLSLGVFLSFSNGNGKFLADWRLSRWRPFTSRSLCYSVALGTEAPLWALLELRGWISWTWVVPAYNIWMRSMAFGFRRTMVDLAIICLLVFFFSAFFRPWYIHLALHTNFLSRSHSANFSPLPRDTCSVSAVENEGRNFGGDPEPHCKAILCPSKSSVFPKFVLHLPQMAHLNHQLSGKMNLWGVGYDIALQEHHITWPIPTMVSWFCPPKVD